MLRSISILLLLGACVASQPTDPKVAADIVKVCMASGFFKIVDGVVALAVPAAALPIALVNAGVDIVCKTPETHSADPSTIEWLVENFSEIVP
jgi:hypothetical protein